MRDCAELVNDLRKMQSTEYCAIASATGFPAIRIVQDAADAIEELLAEVPEWVSVEERLPEHYRVVLVIKDHPVDYLHGYEFAARLQNGEWSGNSRKVLYWMPLPEPPKEETE